MLLDVAADTRLADSHGLEFPLQRLFLPLSPGSAWGVLVLDILVKKF